MFSFYLVYCTEETLIHLINLMSFLPFCHDNCNNHIKPQERASRSSASDDGKPMETGTPASAAVPFVIKAIKT